jgi:hypothetical protein
MTVALPDGTLAHSGGKVIKNVAGYDLSKLFTGSLGTLGVIAECNFRLHPRPEAARTVAVELPDTASAGAASQAILRAQIVPSAVELLWDGETRMITVLIEGIPSGVEAQSEAASHILGSFGEVREIPDGEAGSSSPPGAGGEGVAVKISQIRSTGTCTMESSGSCGILSFFPCFLAFTPFTPSSWGWTVLDKSFLKLRECRGYSNPCSMPYLVLHSVCAQNVRVRREKSCKTPVSKAPRKGPHDGVRRRRS